MIPFLKDETRAGRGSGLINWDGHLGPASPAIIILRRGLVPFLNPFVLFRRTSIVVIASLRKSAHGHRGAD